MIGPSEVSVRGAGATIPEAQFVIEEYGKLRTVYIGGQTARSWHVAYMLAENLLDASGYVPANDEHAFGGRPHRCASLRFGNCLVFDYYERVAVN